MHFKLQMDMVKGGVRKLVHYTERSAILKRDLMGLSMDATGRSEFEAVVVKLCPFMRSEREWQVSPI